MRLSSIGSGLGAGVGARGALDVGGDGDEALAIGMSSRPIFLSRLRAAQRDTRLKFR